MQTKIIETRLMARSRFAAITLFGIVFTWRRECLDRVLLNHERIHCRQQREWLYLPFFALYLAEWLFHLARLRNWDQAYRAISFEREAYLHARDLNYLRHRKMFANYRSRSAGEQH